MKAGPPPLLPLLRSATQARLLAAVLLEPDAERTVKDLAGLANTSLPTATREVRRAEEAGIVRTRTLGGSRLVTVNTASPLFRPLQELLLLTFGPVTVLQAALGEVEGVSEAHIFGSWAARYHGEAGRPPKDIDLLVVGEPDAAQLDEAVETAEAQLRQPVDVTVRAFNAWREGTDPFIAFVRQRPLVRVLPPEEAG